MSPEVRYAAVLAESLAESNARIERLLQRMQSDEVDRAARHARIMAAFDELDAVIAGSQGGAA